MTQDKIEEAKDFMVEIVGSNRDHLKFITEEDVLEIHQTVLFMSWKLRKEVKNLLKEIDKALQFSRFINWLLKKFK